MNEDSFTFDADARGKSFALSIARTMVRLFGVTLSEAIGRVNREWQQRRLFGADMVYHREPEYWAKRIYYEPGTYWWVDSWMAEHTPKPKPYP